jgi:mannose-6-phosphate isomerase
MSHLDDTRPLVSVAGELPFMLKVLAPAQPLSIQVHPSHAMAEAGFAAENAAGVPLNDPSRDFKDQNHKPEMVYALERFDTLLGVRPIEEISALLAPLDLPLTKELLDRVPEGPRAVLEHVLSEPPAADSVDAFVAACATRTDADDVGRAYATVVEAGAVHPGDPGVVLALLLNRVTLEPGEAAFVGPGLVHAHFSGLCLEVMAASDNVFRAGLTTKKVNAAGVLESLTVDDGGGVRIGGVRVGDGTEVFAPDLDGETMFALSVSRAGDTLPGLGHRILLCVDGEVSVTADDGSVLPLARGQAAFASADDGRLAISGDGTLAQAYVP